MTEREAMSVEEARSSTDLLPSSSYGLWYHEDGDDAAPVMLCGLVKKYEAEEDDEDEDDEEGIKDQRGQEE